MQQKPWNRQYLTFTQSTRPGFALALLLLGAACDRQGPSSDTEVTVRELTIDTSASYTIVGVQSGKCVEIPNGSTANGTRLQIATCNATTRQQFRAESMTGGYYRLRNVNSNLCVDVSGASTANGAAVLQWTCGTGTHQQWSFTDVAGGAERLTARHSGQVLDVTGWQTADGSLLEQWPSNGGANQQFKMQVVSSGSGGSSGTGGGTGTGGSGGAGGSVSACLQDWRNSGTCGQWCTRETQKDRAACNAVLNCYQQNNCGPATCGKPQDVCGVNKLGLNTMPKTIADQVYQCLACPGSTPVTLCDGTPDTTPCADANPCTRKATCQAGTCLQSIPVGDGTTCDDNQLCTRNDTCQGGSCKGDAVICDDPGQCLIRATCDPTNGCNAPPVAKPDGTACNDGLFCTIQDSCHGGTCQGGEAKPCPPPVPGAQCKQWVPGVCDETLDACVNPPMADGTQCDDANLCSTNDTCSGGICKGEEFICTHYDPTAWNDNSIIQKCNYCYNYANDIRTDDVAITGCGADQCVVQDDFGRVTVASTKAAALADGLTFVSDAFPGNSYDCGKGHLVFMAVAPQYGDAGDYHWWRLDQADSHWSHKPGFDPAANDDQCLLPQPITNPMDSANCMGYTIFGGFFCSDPSEVTIKGVVGGPAWQEGCRGIGHSF